MASSNPAVALLVAMVAIMVLVQGSMATHYVVGGPLGWELSPYGDPNFYQDWVQSTFPYSTGDTLEFDYQPGDSVILVSKDDFSTCNVQHPIQLWTDGGPKSFEMVGHSIYYFTSGSLGHCAAGQKFFRGF